MLSFTGGHPYKFCVPLFIHQDLLKADPRPCSVFANFNDAWYYNPFIGGHTKVLMYFIRRTDIKTGGHIWDRDVFQIHISDFRPFLRRLGHYLGQHLWPLKKKISFQGKSGPFADMVFLFDFHSFALGGSEVTP